MEVKKAYYITFGCKTNFYDTELIKSNLEKIGIIETNDLKKCRLYYNKFLCCNTKGRKRFKTCFK